MLTEASDDTAEQNIELEMEISRLESEIMQECTQRKEEDDRKKEDARKWKEEEDDRKKEEVWQQKEEVQWKEEAQKEEHEEHARQQKKEQEGQASKARGKYMTFDNRMEDLKRFKEMHGHANVTICEDKSLSKFCATTRYVRNNPGKGTKLCNGL